MKTPNSAEPPFFDGTPESTYVKSWSTRDLVSSYLPADPVSFDAVERGEIIDAVVDELARDHCSQWSEKPGLPAGAPLLRAYDHQWGEGHVHRFEAGRSPRAAKSWKTAPATGPGGTKTTSPARRASP